MLSSQSIRPELLNASAYINGYSPLIPWANAIGIKPNLVKYATRLTSSILANEYLVNSYYVRDDKEMEWSVRQFSEDAGVITQSLNNQRDNEELVRISLPDSAPLQMSVKDAMLRRRSVSQFTGDAVPLRYLATIARSAAGISGRATAQLKSGDAIDLSFNMVSSAGHLYPIDCYFVVLNVAGLEKGIYRYSGRDDVLIKTGDSGCVAHYCSGLAISENEMKYKRCNYMVLFVAQPWKSMCKYGNRGLRFVLQEIGSMSQNIHLAHVCLGLGGTDWGGYYEEEVNRVMLFDGVNQSILHMILAGIPG